MERCRDGFSLGVTKVHGDVGLAQWGLVLQEQVCPAAQGHSSLGEWVTSLFSVLVGLC